MSHRMPDLYLHVGGSHIHHLNYGIFLLSALGAILLFGSPTGRTRELAAYAGHGLGLALTFDEFGMWLHLGGGYWQRASFDAVTVIAGTLALLAFCPWSYFKQMRTGWVAAGVAILLAGFTFLLIESFQFVEDDVRYQFD